MLFMLMLLTLFDVLMHFLSSFVVSLNILYVSKFLNFMLLFLELKQLFRDGVQ